MICTFYLWMLLNLPKSIQDSIDFGAFLGLIVILGLCMVQDISIIKMFLKWGKI